MASTPIRQVTGRAVPVPGDDIDTDRIIPARFMKCVTFDGLGEYLFYDTRKREDGGDRDHPLNDPRFEGASILLCGANFGCGSSREHAPQAILRAGFKGIVAGSFAEIFFGNATSLGIVCVTASEKDRGILRGAVERNPELELTLDVESQKIWHGDTAVACELRPGARDSFLSGNYDPLDELLAGIDQVDRTAASLDYVDA